MGIGGRAAHADVAAIQQLTATTASDPFAAIIAEASRRFRIPQSWIRAVIHEESAGQPRAVSPKGAIGLMQIMPGTWAGLRDRYHLGTDPYDVHDNIIAGTAFLRELHDRYGSAGFLAAYNAGPARWEDHLATGRALPEETQTYVAALVPVIGGGAIDDVTVVDAVARSWTEAPLFVVSAKSSPTKSPSSSDPRSTTRPIDSHAQDWTGLAPHSPGLFVNISGAKRKR